MLRNFQNIMILDGILDGMLQITVSPFLPKINKKGERE